MRSSERKQSPILFGNFLKNSCYTQLLLVSLGIQKKVMAEKTGNTAKLIYDFNTAAVCEVCIKGTWYRTTPRDFRSFDGERRLTQPIKQPGISDKFEDIEFRTDPYNGPIYVVQTNLEVIRMDTNTIVTNPYIEVNQKSLTNSSRT